MTPYSRLSRFALSLWLTVGMVVMLIVIFAFFTWSEKYAAIWRTVFIAFGLGAIFMVWRSYAALKTIFEEAQINDAAIASSINAIAIASLDGKLSYVNKAFVDLWRLQGPEDAIGRSPVEFWDKPEDAQTAMGAVQQQGHWQGELRARRQDGSLADLELSAHIVTDETGQPVCMMGSFVDITARKQAEQQTRISEARYHSVVAALSEGIVMLEKDGAITAANKSAEEILGLSRDQMMGRTSVDPRWRAIHEDGTPFPGETHPSNVTLRTGKPQSSVIMGVHKPDGRLTWISINSQPIFQPGESSPSSVVTSFVDITARKQVEEEIRNLAFYDALTKLPNRRLMLDRIHLALSVSARSNQFGAVLFLDLDRFKTINDTLGYEHGDLLLVEVAQRIQACVREVDTVARLGGDEFVILVEEISVDAQEASQKVALIAEKIRVALAAPYQIKGEEYHSSTSIGVCLYRGHEVPVEALLKHADMAMYQAKDSGRNAVRFFDPLMQQSVETHAALDADLRRALPGKQLRLHYQMQIDNEHRPLGAEVLVRWIHPTRGMISPAQFIPIAEDSSMILEIGHWVLDTACQQLAEWSKNELTRDLVLAVNVSAKQFHLHDFVERVAAVIRANRVDASRLKLELTESVVLSDVTDVVTKMHALKALGVGLSMDDFGTGYSSLSYLKQLPLDQIKIDQSFVRNIATDPNDAVMVETIIDMAQNFRLNVIAEGVETEAQLAFLKLHGCMAYQGYLFSKPVPIEEFEALL